MAMERMCPCQQKLLVSLALNKDSVGETVSVRSEADQLASQLITVTVTSEIDPKICQYEGHLTLYSMS